MPETHDSPAGDLLDGRYRIGERLGRGGMADVYRAMDELLGRDVAVKIIRPGVDGVASPERARGEMSALATLNHPSLVTLLDARLDNADGQDYLVMELVEGPTLSDVLREGTLSEHDTARLASEIAEGLHVVHSADVVHRDIKPSNVLLAPAHLPGLRYRAKLADFGIAYLVDEARVTEPGDVIGTAAYLAPEQVNGAAPAPPADVYALGLVLIEALSGHPAFPHAAGVATALARLNAPPELPDAVSAPWRDLLEQMTRLEPSARPSALDVAIAASRLMGVPEEPSTPVAAAGAAPTELLTAAPAAESANTDVPTELLAAAAAAPLGAGAGAGAGAGDPPTRVMPGLASAAGATAASTGGTDAATAPTDTVPDDGASRPRRRRTLIGAAAVGAAILVGAGAWGIGTLGGAPAPASEEPAVTEETPSTPRPSGEPTDTEADGETSTGGDTRPTDEESTAPSDEESSSPEPDAPAEESPAPADPGTEEPDPTTPVEPAPEPEPTTPVEEPAPEEPAPAEPSPEEPAPDPVTTP